MSRTYGCPTAGDLGVSTCQCTDTGPRTGDDELTYGMHVRPAMDDCFKSFALISVWEFTGRFNSATCCASAAESGFRCRQEYVLVYVLAGGVE